MRRVLALISCVFIMGLCGCWVSEDSIKLDSNKKLLRVAEEMYGKAELISTEEHDSPRKYKTCELRDVRRGFTYHITSQLHTVGLDGAVFGYDGTVIKDDFHKKYQLWLTDVTRDEFEEHGIKVFDDRLPTDYDEIGTDRAVCIYNNKLFTTKDLLEKDLEYVISTICSHDQEVALKGKWFAVYLAPEMECFGQVSFEEILDEDVVGLKYMKKQVKEICGIDIDGFDRTTSIRPELVPGLDEQKLEPTSLDSNNLTKIYYFTYEGQEYFICEAKVYLSSPDKGGEILQYYQNYK